MNKYDGHLSLFLKLREKKINTYGLQFTNKTTIYCYSSILRRTIKMYASMFFIILKILIVRQCVNC